MAITKRARQWVLIALLKSGARVALKLTRRPNTRAWRGAYGHPALNSGYRQGCRAECRRSAPVSASQHVVSKHQSEETSFQANSRQKGPRGGFASLWVAAAPVRASTITSCLMPTVLWGAPQAVLGLAAMLKHGEMSPVSPREHPGGCQHLPSTASEERNWNPKRRWRAWSQEEKQTHPRELKRAIRALLAAQIVSLANHR